MAKNENKIQTIYSLMIILFGVIFVLFGSMNIGDIRTFVTISFFIINLFFMVWFVANGSKRGMIESFWVIVLSILIFIGSTPIDLAWKISPKAWVGEFIERGLGLSLVLVGLFYKWKK